MKWTYDLGTRMTPAIAGVALATYGYDKNGGLISVSEASGLATMSYDKERRLQVHQNGASTATYLYYADDMKALELIDGAPKTIVWDGTDYLQGGQ